MPRIVVQIRPLPQRCKPHHRPALSLHRQIALEGLREYLQAPTLDVIREPSGRPHLVNGDSLPFVSFSHSGQWVSSALSPSTGPYVSIDIEDLSRVRRHLPLIQRYFSPEEQSWVMHGSEPVILQRFYQIWTAKEALAKCTGQGLSVALGINLKDQLNKAPLQQWFPVIIEGEHYRLWQAFLSRSMIEKKKGVFDLEQERAHELPDEQMEICATVAFKQLINRANL